MDSVGGRIDAADDDVADSLGQRVVELRQYTLVPGQRDTLIEVFDAHFVEGQQAVGIDVIGQFRDLDDPDRFVWLRGYDSMAVRGEALPSFYYGPVWRAHSARANATMIDSDNALLLEPMHLGAAYPGLETVPADAVADGVIAVTVAHLARPVSDADRSLARTAATELAAVSADVVAVLATHVAENNFPALPLRDEHVLVWITQFADDAGYARHRELLATSAGWRDVRRQLAARGSTTPMQELRLRPTHRSRLR
jgi:NIPSNAP